MQKAKAKAGIGQDGACACLGIVLPLIYQKKELTQGI